MFNQCVFCYGGIRLLATCHLLHGYGDVCAMMLSDGFSSVALGWSFYVGVGLRMWCSVDG